MAAVVFSIRCSVRSAVTTISWLRTGWGAGASCNAIVGTRPVPTDAQSRPLLDSADQPDDQDDDSNHHQSDDQQLGPEHLVSLRDVLRHRFAGFLWESSRLDSDRLAACGRHSIAENPP